MNNNKISAPVGIPSQGPKNEYDMPQHYKVNENKYN